MAPIYVDSVKEQMIPKVQVEEKLWPVGSVPQSMAFKEKDVPNMLSTTMGPKRETSKGVRQTLGT